MASCSNTNARLADDGFITIRTTIAEELPGVADFGNHVEIEIGDDKLIFVATRLCHDLAAWSAEVTLPIELADGPWFLDAHTVDGTDEVSVGNSVRRLFEFPEIFGKSGDGRRRVKDDLGAVHA